MHHCMSENPATASSSRITKPGLLLPGYKHVESFGGVEDYAEGSVCEEKGESYVTLDLGNVDQALVPNSGTYRLVVSCIVSI